MRLAQSILSTLAGAAALAGAGVLFWGAVCEALIWGLSKLAI